MPTSEVIYQIPDGITDVTKSELTGCYPYDFAAYPGGQGSVWDAALERTASQKSWDDAQAAKDAFDKQKADELAALIARQDVERIGNVASGAGQALCQNWMPPATRK